MKHILLKNSKLHGFEYGVLRAFEQQIIETHNATVVEVPLYSKNKFFSKLNLGTRYSFLRKWLPKKKLKIEADVVWYILMGPENYELDLYNGWQQVQHKVVYIFDTLPGQFNLIKQLFSNNNFTVKITSFNDAVAPLQQLTQQTWHNVNQAFPVAFTNIVPLQNRQIAFSSYGRNLPIVHEAVKAFCTSNNLYYDYSFATGAKQTVSAEELYCNYYWHLQNSIFTISWPVETTNPQRAGILNPITCRWFEALGVATPIIGNAPHNAAFSTIFGNNFVITVQADAALNTIIAQLQNIWDNRVAHFNQMQQLHHNIAAQNNWLNRVNQITQLITNNL